MKLALVVLLVGSISAASLPEQPIRLPLPVDVQQRLPWLVNEPINAPDSRLRDASAKVVGGQPAEVGFAPFQIALERSNSFICGGSLITPRTVLTAAHCVYGYENRPTTFRIRYDTVDRTSGPTIGVAKVIRHPSYSSNTIDYDLAVLILSSEFIPSDSAKVVALAGSNPATGSTVSLTGYGRLTGGGTLPTKLQKATLATISQQDCQSKWGSVNAITSRMLCAWDKTQSACNGDSGGPLTFNGEQVGVVSWGSSSCLHATYPNVYASVGDQRNWITSNSQ